MIELIHSTSIIYHVLIFQQFLDTTWFYNPVTNDWTSGPSMKEKRWGHSCFYDIETNSVFVVGGWNGTNKATTERLNLNTNIWEPTPSLPEPLDASAAVASKSTEYIGFVAGGKNYQTRAIDKMWGPRRRDLIWEEMPQKLQKPRRQHSMVNIAANEVPGC